MSSVQVRDAVGEGLAQGGSVSGRERWRGGSLRCLEWEMRRGAKTDGSARQGEMREKWS